MQGLRRLPWEIITTAVATLAATYIAAYLREKRTARAGHLRVLQNEVINPILTKLTRYYLPLLQLQQAIIIVRENPVEEESPDITSPPAKTSRKELGVSQLGSLIATDQILYADAKRNHFKKFVKQWEEYEEKVVSFHDKCLEITAQYETTVRDLARPEEDSRAVPDAGFVNSTGIAAWIFNKQMGIFSYNYLDKGVDQYRPDHMWIKDPGSGQNLAVGDRKRMENLLDLINKLALDKTKAIEQRSSSLELAERGKQLASEAKEILYSARLKGRCKYH